MAGDPIQDAKAQVLTAVNELLRDLQPARTRQVELAAIMSELMTVARTLSGLPTSKVIDDLVTDDVLKTLKAVQAGKQPVSDLGSVLVALSMLKLEISDVGPQWVNGLQVTKADLDGLQTTLLKAIGHVRQLLMIRPDVASIMDDLSVIKSLRGGPADAVAFHDFQVLQIAFRSIWLHAFDGVLKIAAAQLYEETVRVYDEAGLQVPNFSAISDITELTNFIAEVSHTIPGSFIEVPDEIKAVFGDVRAYAALSSEQRKYLYEQAKIALSGVSKEERDTAKALGEVVLSQPAGTGGRIVRLIAEIGKMLSEPYAFDVFAPDSFNYGVLLTYRQQWDPGPYQAGDLVATIPLAPGEARKFSKKRVVKQARAVKELEKSMSSRSLQTSDTSRAESEIMQRAATATNFKMTAHGSFNIGIGSIDSTTEFGANQEQQSALTKKAFREATKKAAEEYRLERTLEIDTTTSMETEETTSGEISNTNNEITVTYLFYELQRRYQIREVLYRARPVILVAQDVPAPHEITEAWLLQHQWILSRVLLDDSLQPALTYLSSGFAGDEISVEVVKAHWTRQKELVGSLEAKVSMQQQMRDQLRQSLVQTTLQKDLVPSMPGALKFFTFGVDPSETTKDRFEAYRKAAETRLSYAEEALADAQDKLKTASDAFAQATKEYAAALQAKHTRHVTVDQLRVHVKQNILYYMQAIWDHEPADQRFFRLYNKKVYCPEVQKNCTATVGNSTALVGGQVSVEFKNICVPAPLGGGGVGGMEHELVDVADLDNPLGYKGNYMIFALRDECHLTKYMLTTFVDDYLGIRDPDGTNEFIAEDFEQQWAAAAVGSPERAALRQTLIDHIAEVRRSTDEIIVPTGQLFIEALPGAHPLLEDFKLMHRFEDVRKVKGEVRHAELENLRLAARLVEAQSDSMLLDDPDVEKKIVIEGNPAVVVGPNP